MRRLKLVLSSSTSVRMSSGECGQVWVGTGAGLLNCSRRFSRRRAINSRGLISDVPSAPSLSERLQSLEAAAMLALPRLSWWKQHNGTYTPNLPVDQPSNDLTVRSFSLQTSGLLYIYLMHVWYNWLMYCMFVNITKMCHYKHKYAF